MEFEKIKKILTEQFSLNEDEISKDTSFAEDIKNFEVFDMSTKGDGYERIDLAWVDDDIASVAYSR